MSTNKSICSERREKATLRLCPRGYDVVGVKAITTLKSSQEPTNTAHADSERSDDATRNSAVRELLATWLTSRQQDGLVDEEREGMN